MSNQKKIIITFLGNAYHDSRVVNLIDSLSEINFDVRTISFDWKTKGFKTQTGKTSVYKLDKSKSSLSFYFNFFFLLVKFLRNNKASIYFAEDIYTLPVVYFFAKKNNAKLFYNSRELYAHLAGLRNRTVVQSIISRLERKFIYKADTVFVTGNMDAEYLEEHYGINNIAVVRNLPKYKNEITAIDLRAKLGIPTRAKILLYQGVILEGRGILFLINLLDKFEDVHFVVIGEGEYKNKFQKETAKLEIAERVHFTGAVNHSELLSYTAAADIGVALIENISKSYYYALPNKLFEYIMAGIPVLASNLPQMKKIIDSYNIGKCVDMNREDEVVEILKEMLTEDNLLNMYSRNCKFAAKELNWENEFSKVKELLR